jgi:integrase
LPRLLYVGFSALACYLEMLAGLVDWYFLPKRHASAEPELAARRFRFRGGGAGTEIMPHNLSDTAASLSIQEGAAVVAVARLLGHELVATTLNHYTGLFPTDLDGRGASDHCQLRSVI